MHCKNVIANDVDFYRTTLLLSVVLATTTQPVILAHSVQMTESASNPEYNRPT